MGRSGGAVVDLCEIVKLIRRDLTALVHSGTIVVIEGIERTGTIITRQDVLAGRAVSTAEAVPVVGRGCIAGLQQVADGEDGGIGESLAQAAAEGSNPCHTQEGEARSWIHNMRGVAACQVDGVGGLVRPARHHRSTARAAGTGISPHPECQVRTQSGHRAAGGIEGLSAETQDNLRSSRDVGRDPQLSGEVSDCVGGKLDGDDLVVTGLQAGPWSVHHGKRRIAGQLRGPGQLRKTAIGHRHLPPAGKTTGNKHRRQTNISRCRTYLDARLGFHAGAGQPYLEGRRGPVIAVDNQRAAEGLPARRGKLELDLLAASGSDGSRFGEGAEDRIADKRQGIDQILVTIVGNCQCRGARDSRRAGIGKRQAAGTEGRLRSGCRRDRLTGSPEVRCHVGARQGPVVNGEQRATRFLLVGRGVTENRDSIGVDRCRAVDTSGTTGGHQRTVKEGVKPVVDRVDHVDEAVPLACCHGPRR